MYTQTISVRYLSQSRDRDVMILVMFHSWRSTARATGAGSGAPSGGMGAKAQQA